MFRRGVLFWFALWLALVALRYAWESATGGDPALMFLVLPLRIMQLVAELMFLVTGFMALAGLWWNTRGPMPTPAHSRRRRRR